MKFTNNQELVSQTYTLNKGERVMGLSVISGASLALIAFIIPFWWPVVFIMAPALWIAYGILISNVEAPALMTYYRDCIASKDSQLMHYKEKYPSLYENERKNFLDNKQLYMNRFKIAKAMLTGKPETFVFATTKTDEFGGCIQSGVEIKGFTMKIQEKKVQSDIQMWSDAYDNAIRLK